MLLHGRLNSTSITFSRCRLTCLYRLSGMLAYRHPRHLRDACRAKHLRLFPEGGDGQGYRRGLDAACTGTQSPAPAAGAALRCHQQKRELRKPLLAYQQFPGASGLGLYIVNRLLTNHGGYTNIESTPDEGTTFHLYFKHKKN